MPQLKDPNFEQTVVLLCEHGEDGALGLVVNRPTPFTLGDIYDGQDIEGRGDSGEPVHFGGPVQPEMGFVLYEGREYEGSLSALPGVHLGTSLEILRDIAASRGPERFLFCLGYAGWAPDQMEQELGRNDWLVVPATPEILFRVPAEHRWERAVRALGIEPGMLSGAFGTA
ncbi:MAG: YqgE/AlgH family protein [Deferrisomatales bacterium]|nr:YqgE/AlgH family protein [Deferrisomatales bacterium]